MKAISLKNTALTLFVMLGILTVSVPTVEACMIVCFNSSGDCYELEGDCSTVCCNCSCTNTSAFNPATDYMYTEGRKTWIVASGKKTQVATDNLATFIKEMNKKYPVGKRESIEAKKAIAAEFESFFKKPDTSSVSKARLAQLSKETGIRFRTNPPIVEKDLK